MFNLLHSPESLILNTPHARMGDGVRDGERDGEAGASLAVCLAEIAKGMAELRTILACSFTMPPDVISR